MPTQLLPHSIWGDPKRILLDLVALKEVAELPPWLVQRLTEHDSVALARIWLIRPPEPQDCGTCRFASECSDRSRCLHLVASAGRSLDDPGGSWNGLDGRFRRFPIGLRKVGRIAATGEPLEVPQLDPDSDWVADPQWVRREGIVSFVGEPLSYGGELLGVLGLFSREEVGPSCLEWLRMTAAHLSAAIANARAWTEIETLRKRLERENEYLREEVGAAAFGELVGHSPPLQAVARQIDLVAPTDSAVLVLGESGTGKELVAREIHRRSRRGDQPLIKVNCAAIPRELYESEFFGHAKGSFTGALRDRAGRFELAHGGTLFLDEIGEIPLDLQAKLLRVLQEGELERVGEERTRRVDVRLVAATNRNLRAEAEAGRFRQDLYYRLSVFPMELPPLRLRVEDIPDLAEHFLRQYARKHGRPKPRLTLANVQDLQRYGWPGNVRELQHVLERACIVAADGRLQFDLPANPAQRPTSEASRVAEPKTAAAPILTESEMRAFEAANLQRALDASGGRVYGPEGAAARMGVRPTTLASRIKSLGLQTDAK